MIVPFREFGPLRVAVSLAMAGVLAALPLRAGAEVATLYGLLNVSVEWVEGRNADGKTPSVQRLSSNASRFGFRGAEGLGRGLVAIWQIESGVAVDSGSGGLATRESFIGLDGDWGTLKLGHFLSPYDDVLPVFGNVPTLTSSILSTAALWSQGSLSKVAGGFDARLPNSIRYDSPEWNGLEGSVQYALGEDADDSHVLGIGIVYTRGPFEAGLAYERNRHIRGPDLNDWAFSAAAGWNFGPARIAGVYERLRYATPVGPLRRDFYGASATLLAGAGSFYLFYGRAADGKAPASVRVGGLASGAGTGAAQYALSYTYPLSQRTLVYAGYVRLDNEPRASYNFGTNPYTAGSLTGLRLNGLVIGAAHFF